METRINSETDELVLLRTDFPGHRIWRSVRHDGRLGDWVATLRDSEAGVDPTVIRDNAEDLCNALHIERARAAEMRAW
jgi:hypothetical protein